MLNNSRNNRKPKRTSRKNQASLNVFNQTLPVTPGTPVTTHRVQGAVQKFTTTVTSGLIAASLPIDASDINSWSRFGLYDEYRIIKCVFHAYPCSAVNPGSICMWVEPKSSTTPTFSISANNYVTQFSAGGNMRPTTLTYRPTDIAYALFQPTSTSTFVIGYLNVYTDNANYAAPITATDLFVIRAEYTIQFRGFG